MVVGAVFVDVAASGGAVVVFEGGDEVVAAGVDEETRRMWNAEFGMRKGGGWSGRRGHAQGPRTLSMAHGFGGGVEEFVDEGDAVLDAHGAGADGEAGVAEEGFVGVAGVAVVGAAGDVAVDDGGVPGGGGMTNWDMRGTLPYGRGLVMCRGAGLHGGDVGVEGALVGEEFVYDPGDAAALGVAEGLDPECDEGAGVAEVDAGDEFFGDEGAVGEEEAFAGGGLAVEGPGLDVDGAAEGGEEGVFEDGGVAEHFVFPGGAGDAGVHGDGVGDGKEALGGFGAALAVGPDGTGGAFSIAVAFADDVPEAPGEGFAGRGGGWCGIFG